MPEDQTEPPGESQAGKLGRRVGRLRRKLHESRPQAEKAAREAIEAARPAADQALRFVRDHQDELRAAGAAGARLAARRAVPPALHPVVAAVDHELASRATKRNRVETEGEDGAGGDDSEVDRGPVAEEEASPRRRPQPPLVF